MLNFTKFGLPNFSLFQCEYFATSWPNFTITPLDMVIVVQAVSLFAGASRLLVCFMSAVRLVTMRRVEFDKYMEQFCFFIGITVCYGISLLFTIMWILYGEKKIPNFTVFESVSVVIMDLGPSLAIFVTNITILKMLKRISFRQKQVETQLSFSSWLSNKNISSTKHLKRQKRTNQELFCMLTLGVIFYTVLYIPRFIFWFLSHFEHGALTRLFSPLVSVSITMNSVCHVVVLVAANRDIRTAYLGIPAWFTGKTRWIQNKKTTHPMVQNSIKVVCID